MPIYTDAKIYKLINSVNDKIYIGSTCQLLCNRMSCHRSHAERRNAPVYQEMRKLGIENFKIVLIEPFSCDSKEKLEKREYHIMRRYIRQGVKLLNSTVEFGRHSAEQGKKASAAMKGRRMSDDHRKKISAALRGKCMGSSNRNFKRGSLRKASGKCPRWLLTWRENGKECSKSFSINKYGEKQARRLAEKAQNAIYPLAS